MVLRLTLTGLLLVLMSCSNSSTIDINSTEVKQAQSGQKLYRKYCQSCHGKKGDAGRGNAANLKTSKISTAAIKDVILHGNNKGMMAYENLLETESELDSLVQHVITLRKK